MPSPENFRLTYSTMFDPPAELHERFDAALARVRTQLGREHAMCIAGRRRGAAEYFEVRSPIDRDVLLARLPGGSAADAADAVASAVAAYPAWAATPWPERVRILLRAAALIEERVYEISAAVALEIGKNRMESLGEVQETADLVRWYCEQMQAHDGFERVLPDDPLPGWRSHNRTRLRPYGAWAVIAPFNFPFALAGGPIAAALVAGNSVVFKVASDTAWSGVLLMQAFDDAGVPPGALNHVIGAGGEVGAALAADPRIAGITFTGSYGVGMGLVRASAQQAWPRPCIVEMGGKNAAIVSRHADLERAATGIVRSAFGLQGQKCSACSRVYVERQAAPALRERVVALAEAISVGDPSERQHWMGPLINEAAYRRYAERTRQLREEGVVYTGARLLEQGALARGWFVAPTVGSVATGHALWRDEHFLPLVLLGEVDSVDEAIALANASDYGLTAGFYGAEHEIAAFLDRIEAGVTYVNRPQGATTGAWPGYQPFGGWKASGSTGKAIGSFWYLPQYLREQSQTVVE